MSVELSPPEISYLGEDDADFFQNVDGRILNTLNPRYMLPVDRDEVKRSELHHRLLQFVFGGKNYIGPVKEALQFGEHRRILDLGTGGGFWAIDMADNFPRAEVIGIDLAPIQPRLRAVPPNCTFELCDLDQWNIPYPDNHFDFIHARSVHCGIHNYPQLLREITRLLRPGGLVLLIEPNLTPLVDGKSAGDSSSDSGLRGWLTLWETYRACLTRKGIDVTVPECLGNHLMATKSFERVMVQDGNIPVGFWPSDPHLLTVGQLQWMDYELFLPALRPLFLSFGMPQSTVHRIIADAQQDLYHPSVPLSARLHIVYASKRY
ncbi:S-adenosyl-L-methionine-dependent methyltransferase [Collybia nuda]|uniref:S-adenosyl-L-methionine-dependent methyltransferase n=1 Tax=Collybia nuda TaxID=64659 RepID=A0A9P5YAD0_9AGAR|nr:S-adenosyl-L-methionine-dependent methyltransferase [Collybia nuda]